MNTASTAAVQSNSGGRTALSETEIRKLTQEVERLTGRERSMYWFGKRLFDIIASGMMILALLPLFLVISAVIVLDDPHGSPLYSQTRGGRHGINFYYVEVPLHGGERGKMPSGTPESE